VFADVGMPHALWELEGMKKAVKRIDTDADGNEHTVIEGYEMVTPGSMSESEYDQAARDLTNFLAYTGEPIKLKRQQIGVYVLIFLFFFFIVAYLLKKEYWKDVH
jgi:ubiquinol-cytochrome c reductase cytochrome c1 subunit